MTLSEQSAALRRRLYDNRHWLPLLLYPAALLALLIARPFNIIPDSFVFTLLCAVISLLGVAVRVLTVGYLPRKSEEEVESGVHSTTLITQGMYSTVRHPIALGNLLAWYGIILYVGVTWFIIGAAMLYTLFTYLVLMSEEEELKQRFGERYTDWARYTNALIPNRKLWVSNRYRFSLMQVIRREYVGFFCLVLAFVTINLIRNRVIEFTWGLSPLWSTVGAITLLFTIFIRVIIKLINK